VSRIELCCPEVSFGGVADEIKREARTSVKTALRRIQNGSILSVTIEFVPKVERD